MNHSNWIPMRKALRTDPRVLLVAAKLGVTRAAVIGGLFMLWCIADDHGEKLPKELTMDVLDAEVGIPKFCEALPDVWLKKKGALRFPNYDKENGKTARVRMQTRERVRKHRNKKKRVTGNATPLTDQTRPDQTREEDIKPTPTTPTNDDAKALAGYLAEVVLVNVPAGAVGKLLLDFGLGSVVEMAEHLASRKPSQRFDGVRNRQAFIRSLCKRVENGEALEHEANEHEPFENWRARRDEEVGGVK